MNKNVLLLFALAFFIEAIVLSILANSTNAEPQKIPVSETIQNLQPITQFDNMEQPSYLLLPADQTVIYANNSDETDSGLMMLSVTFAMISGFIFGYVRYF